MSKGSESDVRKHRNQLELTACMQKKEEPFLVTHSSSFRFIRFKISDVCVSDGTQKKTNGRFRINY